VRFKVKNIDISTGSVPVVVLDRNECLEMDIHLNERVRIVNKKNKKEIVAAVDFYEAHLPKTHIILMAEVTKKLNVKDGQYIELFREENPIALRYIKEKLNGIELNKPKIEEIITAVVNGRLTDIDLTYFVSSCYIRGLSIKEIVALTSSIVDTGEVLDLRSNPREHIYDKHCVGGVAGNRTTMCVIPIIAAYGLKIPKTSSRAITSPAGTADTMEVLANVCLDNNKLKEVVAKTNACLVWGGALNLAPADDKIIRVEHPLSIDTNGLMLSSILAKKLSVGSTHILIDIPYGEYSKIKNSKRAKALKKLFIKIGKKLGLTIQVIITNGTEPIGNGIGPLLEALDVLKVLQNDPTAPKDLREKTLFMATELLSMHLHDKKKSKAIVTEILDSGKAYHKFMDILSAQGKKKLPPLAKYHATVYATHSGIITAINNNEITRVARFCGAPKSKEAGIYLHKKVHEKIGIGEPLVTLYANNEESLKYATDYFKKSDPYTIKIHKR
jgi:putative thymidine phosphorylase